MPREIKKTIYTFQELIDAAKDPASGIKEKHVDTARGWLQEAATDDNFWSESVIQMWQEALAAVGFENAEIHWSGFGSQGDGASFVANVDLVKLVKYLASPIESQDCISYDATTKREDFLPWIVHKCNGKQTNPRYAHLAYVSGYIGVSVKRNQSMYSHEHACSFIGEFDDTGECGNGPYYAWTSDQPRLRKLFETFVDDAEQLRKDLCRAIYASLQKEYNYRRDDKQLLEDAEANDYTFDQFGKREGY